MQLVKQATFLDQQGQLVQLARQELKELPDPQGLQGQLATQDPLALKERLVQPVQPVQLEIRETPVQQAPKEKSDPRVLRDQPVQIQT